MQTTCIICATLWSSTSRQSTRDVVDILRTPVHRKSTGKMELDTFHEDHGKRTVWDKISNNSNNKGE
eukprot:11911207-Ditylum_brightwellii.AAC.1